MSLINNITPVSIALDQRFILKEITTLKIQSLDAHVVAKLAQKILNGVYVSNVDGYGSFFSLTAHRMCCTMS